MKKSDSTQNSCPLCVDLDGTLILTDVLWESMLLLIKRNPLYILCFPFWILKGKAFFKAEVAERVSLNPAFLPYNQKFLEWLKQEKSAGRTLLLCTGSYQSLADAVAKYLDIFDGVMATDKKVNLAGENKAKALVVRFGEKKFDYCGNEGKDLAVWKVSRHAIIVNGGTALEESARKVTEVEATFPRITLSSPKPLLKALRLPQWAKNVLIFVPVVTAHHMEDAAALKASLLAFLSFCFCASAVYLLNDMLDIEADRQHPMALLLPSEFLIVLAGYYLLTTAYSFLLKRFPLIDTLCLACLYTIRVVAGSAATGLALSFWLILFSVFFFLSLAMVKRCAELDALQRSKKEQAAGRDYKVEDLLLLKMFGINAGYLSILVLALYINSDAVVALYSHPQIIWFLCLLMLFWISRIWLKTHHGEMHHDPVIFALKDKTSLVIGLLALLTLLVAT
jgi:4-hydroxybenzoate polyprenyltransferase